MKRRSVILLLSVLASCIILTAGCGGGGGGSGSAPAADTIVSGVAATGVPLANAAVTLSDAASATKTTTAGANGNYSFSVAGMTAPFVIKASASVAATTVTLVSVQDAAPASGTTLTVNITPVTNAIAAVLSSTGDPLALDAKADGATIKNEIADVKTFVAQTLAPTLAAAGVDTTKFDPVNTAFKADGTGLDKALDNFRISIAPDGTVSMSNKTAVGKIDDVGQSSTAPAASTTGNASTVITFSRSDDFKAKTAALAIGGAPKLEATVEDASVVNKFKDPINACFKLPSTQRSSDQACLGLVSPTYKNNGMTAMQELGGLLSDPAMDNAIFDTPEVIRFLYSDPTKPADRVLVKIAYTRTDGVVDSIVSVAKNFGGGTGWMPDGNQRDYFLFTNAVINRFESAASVATPAYVSHYQSGINLYINSSAGKAATINWVKVTGPGLPSAGVVLKPSLGACAYLSIASKTGNTGGPSPNNCVSVFKLTGIALDGSTAADKSFGDATDTANNSVYISYNAGKVADSALSAIKPLDAYTYQIRDKSGSDTYVVDRLLSRPMTLAEITSTNMSRKWYSVDAATKNSLDPTLAGAFTGGAVFPMAWVRPDGMPPVYAVNVQFKSSASVPIIDANPRVPSIVTSFKVNAPNGTNFPGASNLSGGFQQVQVVGRNEDNMQIFFTQRYENF